MKILFMNGATHSIRSISSSVILLLAISAHAATVWDGPTMSFSKANYANPLLAANQDQLTPNVWITRNSAQGLFNAHTEGGFTHFVSPAGTEWANGSLDNYATLSYTDWNHWARGVNPGPPSTVGVQAVLHLIPDDIYLSVRFTSWSAGAPGGGPSYGGGFSYLRSTPVPEPSSLLLFGIMGLGAALAATFRSHTNEFLGREGTITYLNGMAFRISYVGGDGNDVTLTATPPRLNVVRTSDPAKVRLSWSTN